ncbi:MAG: YraN family protein [Alphaproteobacteria bacterium]|nr:YraN family protein [Alphaproteobacteria bacterium]
MANLQQNNQEVGQFSEEIASDFLIAKGWIILERNWRHKHWEIDIIALFNNTLHFVEVKMRSSNTFGYPEEAIKKEKMNHLKWAASAYQLKNPKYLWVQFDVVSILLTKNRIQEIFLIEDVYLY